MDKKQLLIFVIVAEKVLETDGIAVKVWKVKGLSHILFKVMDKTSIKIKYMIVAEIPKVKFNKQIIEIETFFSFILLR